MILTQFDQEAYEKALKEEATEQGMKQGIAIGERNYLQNLIHKKLCIGEPPAKIAADLCTTIESIEEIIETLTQNDCK